MAIAPSGPAMAVEAENAKRQTGAAGARPWPSQKAGSYALFAVIFATFITFLDQTAFGLLAEKMKISFGMSDFTLGLLPDAAVQAIKARGMTLLGTASMLSLDANAQQGQRPSVGSGRVKTPAISTKSDTQICIALNNVRMNDASAILAVTAAATDVGGVSSPHTARKKQKKCTTQGSTPTRIIGGTMTSAVMM